MPVFKYISKTRPNVAVFDTSSLNTGMPKNIWRNVKAGSGVFILFCSFVADLVKNGSQDGLQRQVQAPVLHRGRVDL